MTDENSKDRLSEFQELISSSFLIFRDLLKRAGDAFQLATNLERYWQSSRRPSKRRRVAYLEELQRIRSLAKEYMKWIEENPEQRAEDLEVVHAQLSMMSEEEKSSLKERLIAIRNERLERQLPELTMIVDNIDASVGRLKEIVTDQPR